MFFLIASGSRSIRCGWLLLHLRDYFCQVGEVFQFGCGREVLELVEEGPVLGVQVLLACCLSVPEKGPDLADEDETLDGLAQGGLAEKLLFLVELVADRVLLEVPLSLQVLVAQSYDGCKLAGLHCLLQLQQNQPALDKHLVSMNLDAGGEGGLDPRNDQLIGWLSETVVVLSGFVGVWDSEHFEGMQAIAGDGDFLVVGGGEEGKVELLEHILLDVIVVDGAEVVEASNVLQPLADARLKLTGHTHDRQVHSFLRGPLDEGALLRKTAVPNVGDHDDPVLAVSASVLLQPSGHLLQRFLKAVSDSGPSSGSDLCQLFVQSLCEVLLHCHWQYCLCLCIEHYDPHSVIWPQLRHKHLHGFNRQLQPRPSLLLLHSAQPSAHRPGNVEANDRVQPSIVPVLAVPFSLHEQYEEIVDVGIDCALGELVARIAELKVGWLVGLLPSIELEFVEDSLEGNMAHIGQSSSPNTL